MEDARLWRDYERGKVGFSTDGKPRGLLDPAEAREKADQLEALLGSAEAVDPTDMAFIETLRRYADDVERR